MPTINLLQVKRKPVKTIRKGKYQDIYQDKRWKKLRSAKLRANPLCEVCEAKDRVNQASEVHHRIPFDTGVTPEQIEELAFDFDNLMSLCIPCHSEIHDELDRNKPNKTR